MSSVRSRMRCRALRLEAFNARIQGSKAASKDVDRDANPYAGMLDVANRYAWFTGFDGDRK